MIICRPHGICSWNFTLEGKGGNRADLSFNWLSEQGTIRVNGLVFEVRKNGVFSGQWSLYQYQSLVATAQKNSPFTRTFTVNAERREFLLSAQSVFSRSFALRNAEYQLATFEPNHMFTRRAKIYSQSKDIEFLTLAFCFWLVVITWKRAANNSNSN